MLLLHQLFKVVPELLADTSMQREYLLSPMTFCWFAYITIGCASLLVFAYAVPAWLVRTQALSCTDSKSNVHLVCFKYLPAASIPSPQTAKGHNACVSCAWL